MGLAIKDENVKKSGKDDIAIECISARLLKTRSAIKAYFVTFVVAYAPTEEAPEGQKARYMATLNSTVAPVPAREHFFILIDADARTGRRSEGGGKADRKVLGACGRDVLNENGKLLLFRRRQCRSSEHFFLHLQKWLVLHFPKRQLQQGTITFGLYPEKTGGPPTDPLVNVPRPPLEVPESEHNFVNAFPAK